MRPLRGMNSPVGHQVLQPEIVTRLGDDRLIARVQGTRVSEREWKLGVTWKENVCTLCHREIPAKGNAWREASGNQNSSYRALRVCTRCWPANGLDPIMVEERGDKILDIRVKNLYKQPNKRLVINRRTAYALLQKLRVVFKRKDS